MDTAEISRRMANLIKKGEIAEVDAARALVRVRCGELLTDWLPYLVPAAGGVSIHRPPSVGEISLLIAPSGEPADAVVLCGYAGQVYVNPAQSQDVTVIKFPDGALFEYDHQKSHLNISGIQSATVQASGQVLLNTPKVICTGQLIVQGLLTYQAGLSGTGGTAGTVIDGSFEHRGELINSGSISSNGVELSNHVHSGVQSGGDKTGVPE